MARKLLHVSAVVDASITYELMELLEGKAVAGTLVMKPVRHGGEDESGAIKSAPTGREFVLAYTQAHPTFKSIDAKTEAVKIGMKKQTLYSAIMTLANEGVLKNIGHGMYKLNKGAAKKAAKPKAPRHSNETVAAKMLAVLRKLQNGSGEGVHIQQIKQAMEKAGAQVTGTSPTLAKLMKDKLVTRPAPAHYRAVEA